MRGYRIDVWDAQASAWRSLCQRVGRYRFTEPAGGGAPIELTNEEDEGFVQMGATESLNPAATRVLRAHESLFTWDGWSLSAPRPGQTILPDHTTGNATNPAVTPFKMEVTFRAKPRSLPRLRFGYRYRLRARVVDLAGNSVFAPSSPDFTLNQPEISEEVEFGRWEPISPPPLLLRALPKEGESLERITVRSAVEDAPGSIAAQTSERHLAPPKVSQLMAERHRKFDGATSMRKESAAYDLASREAGSLTHRLDLASGSLVLLPGVQEVDEPTQKRTYWLQSNEGFDIPYLPDPHARGVLLLGLPGMAAWDEMVDGVNRLPFQGAWPDPKPFRLRLQGLPAGDAAAAPQWDALNRVLTVQLAQGETAQVRVACYFEEADLEQMGVWGWTAEAAPPNLATLKAEATAGRNWLHLPFRELVLVHAVQQPLAIPALSALAVAPARQVGDTSAWLSGTLAVDGKSTGKVDLWAEWADPLDNPDDPANDPTTDLTPARMMVRELTLPDPGEDAPTLLSLLQAMNEAAPALRHPLGDTKYHQVRYTPIGSTRFREHFPPAVLANADNLVRPRPGETPVTTVLDIPNSSRPAAPKPLYLLPAFQWFEHEAAGIRTRERRGGGMRLYLERPWFDSGAGELLGVLVRPSGLPATGEAAETLQKYSSEWGRDPIWRAAETEPLRWEDVANGAAVGHNLTLAELPSQGVHVVGFKPVYDAERNLWVADIQLDAQRSYMPFVRLALARYQPISVPGAHLSPVVLSDFVQVPPHRLVEYDLNNVVPGGTLPIRVIGPSYQNDGEVTGTSLLIARLERRQHGDTLADEPMGWEPFATIVLERTGQTEWEMVWEGTLDLPTPLPQPLRVSVLEVEGHRADGRVPTDLLGLITHHDPATGHGRVGTEEGRGYRVVFADATLVG